MEPPDASGTHAIDARSLPNASQIGSLVIAILYLVLTLQQAAEPFVIDEMEFPRLAEAISETGRPVYYRGEQSPEHLGVFHPPLYAYTLALWVQLAGFSEFAIRLFGILLMLGTAWLSIQVLNVLGVRSPWVNPTFLALFLLHPFVLQSALLPDIDGTVLLFAAVLVVHEVARLCLSEGAPRARVVTLGLALGLAFASKLTSLPLVAFVVVSVLITKGLWRAVITTLAATAIGAGSFLLWWSLVAWLARVSFSYPFEFTLQSGLKGGISDLTLEGALSRLWPADSTVHWIGYLLPILLVWGTIVAISKWRTDIASRLLVPIALWAVGSYVLYALITGPPFGFPKYYIASLPMAAMVATVPVAHLPPWNRLSRANQWFLFAIATSAVTVSYWQASAAAMARLYPLPNVILIFALLVVGLYAVTRAFRFDAKRGQFWIPTFYLAVVFALVTSNLGQDLVDRTINQNSTVRYFPGEQGFEPTVDLMRHLVAPGEPFLGPKDVGSATYNAYHEEEYLFRDPDRLAEVLDDPEVRYAVVRTTWDYSYLIFPEVQSVIETRMTLIDQIGDFLVYQKPEADK